MTFGGLRAGPDLKNYGFTYVKHMFFKNRPFASESFRGRFLRPKCFPKSTKNRDKNRSENEAGKSELRGRFWSPKRSQNGAQNRWKIDPKTRLEI